MGLQLKLSSLGTPILGTYNFPVDLPEGTNSVRDIVNLCCVANPCVTFFLDEIPDRSPWIGIEPDLIGFFGGDPPPTTIDYWRSELDAKAQSPPDPAQVARLLGSDDPVIRAAARKYLYFFWMNDFRREVVSASRNLSPDKALWVGVGELCVQVKTDGVTDPVAIESIKRIISDPQATSLRSALKVLGAMELARVTKDITFLQAAARPPLSEAEIGEINNELVRILVYSRFARTNLADMKPSWFGFSQSEIELLGNRKFVSIP
jgi:hypothetical protein